MKQLVIFLLVLSLRLSAQNYTRDIIIAGNFFNDQAVKTSCLIYYLKDQHQPLVKVNGEVKNQKFPGPCVIKKLSAYVYQTSKNAKEEDDGTLIGKKSEIKSNMADDALLDMIAKVKGWGKIVFTIQLTCPLTEEKNDSVSNYHQVTVKLSTKEDGEYAGCDEISASGEMSYKAKLLMGDDKDIPVQNMKLSLLDKSEKEIQTTTTDIYGDFTFEKVNKNETYKILLNAYATAIQINMVYVTKPDGTLINKMKKEKTIYTYPLLPEELNKVTIKKNSDLDLTLKQFVSSRKKELTIIENINYIPNSDKITASSVVFLDKLAKVMSENKELKLIISTHTDPNGDDATNKNSSQNNANQLMNFFTIYHIAKERITPKGLGETEIINRCKNGIKCSEMENNANRRTEFKLIK